MKKMSLLPLLALVIAVAASAFTVVSKNQSDLVWFKLDPLTGQPINASSGGQQSTADPFGCSGDELPCSVALSIEDQEVIDNNGSYGIAPGVDHSNPGVYEDMRFEEQ